MRNHITSIPEREAKEYDLRKVLTKIMADNHTDSAELSHHTGVPIPTINRLRSDKNSNPTLATLLPIANYFGISINQLIGKEEILDHSLDNFDKTTRKNISIPVIPIECIGQAFTKDAYPTVTASVKTISADSFAIMVKYAFITPQFPENAILIFDPHLQPHHRDYAIVRLEGHQKPTLRQLLIDGDDCYFKPLSQELGEIVLGKQHDIIAVMVQALMNYRD